MYIKKIRLFHLTYCEISTEYAEAFFFDLLLCPASIFWHICMSNHRFIDFWP